MNVVFNCMVYSDRASQHPGEALRFLKRGVYLAGHEAYDLIEGIPSELTAANASFSAQHTFQGCFPMLCSSLLSNVECA